MRCKYFDSTINPFMPDHTNIKQQLFRCIRALHFYMLVYMLIRVALKYKIIYIFFIFSTLTNSLFPIFKMHVVVTLSNLPQRIRIQYFKHVLLIVVPLFYFVFNAFQLSVDNNFFWRFSVWNVFFLFPSFYF
jgi:hypothetical protein